MKTLLVLIVGLALALSARGQDTGDSPTPAPSLAPAGAPPQFKSTMTVKPPTAVFSFTVSDATSPAQFKVMIDKATPAEILGMITNSQEGVEVFASLLEKADGATQRKIVAALATGPAAMEILLKSTKGAEIFSTLISKAEGGDQMKVVVALASNPEVFADVMSKADGATQLKVVQALATRAAEMTLDKVQTTDLDVLTATLRFAMLDPRYKEIDHMSYYGIRLTRLQRQINAEGLTVNNKAALVKLYGDASASLQQFLANEQKQ